MVGRLRGHRQSIFQDYCQISEGPTVFVKEVPTGECLLPSGRKGRDEGSLLVNEEGGNPKTTTESETTSLV